jgi:hypothetical protein
MATPRLSISLPPPGAASRDDLTHILEKRANEVRVGGARSTRPSWASSPSGTEKGFNPRVEDVRETPRSRVRNAPGRVRARLGDARRAATSSRGRRVLGGIATGLAGLTGLGVATGLGGGKETANTGASRLSRFPLEALDDFSRDMRVVPRSGLAALLGGGLLGAGALAASQKLRSEEAQERASETNDRIRSGPLQTTRQDERSEGFSDLAGDFGRRVGYEQAGTLLGGAGGLLAGAMLGRGAKGLLARSGRESLKNIAQTKPVVGLSGLIGAGAGLAPGAFYGNEAGERSVDRKYNRRAES